MEYKRNRQITIINDAFKSIPSLSDGFLVVADRLYEMNRQAEREHRKFRPSVLPADGLSITLAAKLFTVRYLLDGFAEPEKWGVDAILSIRLECLYAQAYAKKHHKELEAWAAKWTEPFSHVDYSQLMKVVD